MLVLSIAALAGMLILAALLVLGVRAQTVTKTAATSAAQARTFATPQQAADALIDAAEKFNISTLDEILGREGYDITHSGEPVRDREQATAFAAMAREKQHVAVNGKLANRAFLTVGPDDWPFPIPIVKRAGRWSFDAKAGRQEILYRRIGRNELDAIEICRGFVEAQHEYALMKRDVYKVNQYAQRIISTPGQQDGLGWQNPDGTWGGPVGENIARAIQSGYKSKTEPFHGYFFKVLKGQGPAAPLGQMDFVVKGVMIGGFALVASPAQYGVTGVKSFMVSHDGVVYEKDLGPNTLSAFEKMERFNPDKSWSPVNEP
ncbi:MAG TPA: DUF2950 domain-containing protein [Blastocatellia bacterium]|nr:DUF2950 domain-containing protein [Blastocatellia bacterium]